MKPKKSGRKQGPAGKRRRLRTGRLLLALFLVAGLMAAAYLYYLAVQIETRFAARRWSIPSTVYSDTTLLYPGGRIDPALFREKLRRLEYHTVDHPPRHPGEMQWTQSAVALYLHDLTLPQRRREGFPVRIVANGNEIRAIHRLDTGRPLPLLELEPEKIMHFFGPSREKRQLVSIQEVPGHLVKAVLAAEDSRFFEHHGVDPRGLLRALWVNLRRGGIRQGGSTLTQQLAKNYFLTPERTFTRKFKELLIALIIELKYQKDEILEIYLNEIYFGQKGSVSINGIGEATRFYFGKPAAALSRAEAALLAGLIKGPNLYSPYVDRERCRRRRDTVLTAMHRQGWISEADLRQDLARPIRTAGAAAYGNKAPYFVDYLAQQLTALYPPEALQSLGLSIYTTLDTQVQLAAEAALETGLARLEKRLPPLARRDGRTLQGAVVVMQPKTGAILALVGGRDYTGSQFNRITQARRQPGSLFKPFVALAALEGFTPACRLSNTPRTYEFDGRIWEPKNASEGAPPEVDLRTALVHSHNRAMVDLAMKTGLDSILAKLAPFEFSTPIRPYPSLALGPFEMVPLEIARAYCAFAADGVLPFPLSLKEVADENGRILEQRHVTIKQAASPAEAFLISDLLRDVVQNGTASALEDMGIDFPAAGKTGTTNNFRDAWFVGYTPDILALVWVGFDNGDPIHAAGAGAALPIWAELLKAIPHQVSGGWFQRPPGVESARICRDSGLLANGSACPRTGEELFLAGTVPRDRCPLHRSGFPFIRWLERMWDE